jgi:hypothetical protein
LPLHPSPITRPMATSEGPWWMRSDGYRSHSPCGHDPPPRVFSCCLAPPPSRAAPPLRCVAARDGGGACSDEHRQPTPRSAPCDSAPGDGARCAPMQVVAPAESGRCSTHLWEDSCRPDGRYLLPERRSSGADPTRGGPSIPETIYPRDDLPQMATSVLAHPTGDPSPTRSHRLGVLPVNQIALRSTGKPDTWSDRRDGGGGAFGTGKALTGAGAFGWACRPRKRSGAARAYREPPNSPREGPGRARDAPERPTGTSG